MYEELYHEIPDINAYLKRIGMDSPTQCNLTYLNRLIFAHQCAIPFENLDVINGNLPISMDADLIFDKIITRKRGGYCFELNTMFKKLISALGYHAEFCRCRILRRKDYLPPVLHVASLITLEDELYFCDVGYGGPQPGGAVKIEDGLETVCASQRFRMKKNNSYWWTMSYFSNNVWEDVLQFTLMPQDIVDFAVLNHYCSTSPECIFTKKVVVNRRLVNGSISLSNNRFTKLVNGIRTEEQISDQTRYQNILKQEFGIEIQ